MTRPTKRRVARAVDDLEAEIDATPRERLAWRDFIAVAAGTAEPADFDVTRRELDAEWLARYGTGRPPEAYTGTEPPDGVLEFYAVRCGGDCDGGAA